MADAPTGPNILYNPYYARRNHVRLARMDRDRTEFFGSIGGEPGSGSGAITVVEGGVTPTPFAYFDQDTINVNPTWSTQRESTNYESTEGNIVDATYVVNGTDRNGTFTLSEGDVVTCEARDDAGNVRTWSIDPSVAAQPPVAAGGLLDQAFTEDTGVQTYDTSGDFTGSGITYTVTNMTGVSVGSSTGIVSFDTDVIPPQIDRTITVTARNSGGNTPSSFDLDILYIAPTAAGNLPDLTGTVNTGQYTFDTSVDFTGEGLTYSVSTVTGVSIDSATGVISFNTNIMDVADGTAVTVTATNTGGSANSSFDINVRHAAPLVNSPLADQTFIEDTGIQTYDTSFSFTGDAITYAVNSVIGVTIDSSTGIVSFDTAAMAVVDGIGVVVTATNNGGSADNGFDTEILSSSPGTITPNFAIETQRTYATQFVDWLDNYETLTNPASYNTDAPGATIDTPVIQTFDGGLEPWITRIATYSFIEGQAIRVYVTDSAGSEYTFALSTVEYLSKPQVSADGFGQLDVNDIVLGGTVLPISFEGDSSGYVTFTSLTAAPSTIREMEIIMPALISGSNFLLIEEGDTLTMTPPCTAYDPSLGTTIAEVWTTDATNEVDVSDPFAPTLLIDAADTGELFVTCTTTQTLDAGGSISVASTQTFAVGGAGAVWSNEVWDDPTDTYTADFSNATRYDWALYNSADGVPGWENGFWIGAVAESGGAEIASNGSIAITPTYSAGIDADRLIVHVSNASTEDSSIYTFTEAAAVWSNEVWDDPTDTYTADYDNASRYDWALYNDADGQPTVLDGVWTGTTAASGGALVSTSGSLNLVPAYSAGVDADRFIVVLSNGIAPQDTNVYTFTENVLSDPTVTMIRYNSGSSPIAATDGGLDWDNNATVPSGHSSVDTSPAMVSSDANYPVYAPGTLFDEKRYTDAGSLVFTFRELETAYLLDGDYTLRLYLTEDLSSADSSGERIYDFELNSVIVESNFDVFVNTGYLNRDIHDIPYTLNSGSGEIAIRVIKNASSQQNIRIHAVEVIRDTLAQALPDSEIVYRVNSTDTEVVSWDYPGNENNWNAIGTVLTQTDAGTYDGFVNGRDASLPDYVPQGLFSLGVTDPSLTFTFNNTTTGASYPDGTYAVRFYGAEPFHAAANRPITVTVNGAAWLTDWDPWDAWGTDNGGMVEWTGSVTGGEIVVQFDGDTAQNPDVRGLEIRRIS